MPELPERSLQDKIAIVTGASSGIGRAIALHLAHNGAEVCLVARRRDALEEVASKVHAGGGRARVFAADWTSDQDVHTLVQSIQQDFGRADVLVVCGGTMFHGRLEQAPLEQLDLQYRANFRGPYALIQLLIPLLRRQQGQIVFTNSSAALRSPAAVGQYAAMQAGLRAVADSLRDEVNADGIRVLSVYLGRTATPRMAALFEREGRSYRPELLLQPEDVAAMVTCALSLPRTAEVTDISMRPMLKSY
ncbi:MAG TPA: SDR family oxidoreductase [Terriglobales bacterium]|nr:SDR family oxidoreductase [Terriglobales bacterium]